MTKPFIPRVLRSDRGTVAVEVDPAIDRIGDMFRLVTLGPDGQALLSYLGMSGQGEHRLSGELLYQSRSMITFREMVLRSW